MTAAAVHTVFRCVASWNRRQRRGCPTLGVAVSLLADRLRTTGRIYITLFGLAPTPLEAVQTPAFECRAAPQRPAMRSIAKLTRPLSEKFVLGRGAARHSNRAASTPGRGRAMRSIATGFSPKFGQDLPMTAAATPRGRPVPLGTRKLGFSLNFFHKFSPNAPTPAILTMRVAASGKSYELYRVARAAGGGGDSRTPTECRFPTGRPIFGRPARKTAPPPCSAPRSLSARQRNLVQTRTLRLNDFAL